MRTMETASETESVKEETPRFASFEMCFAAASTKAKLDGRDPDVDQELERCLKDIEERDVDGEGLRESTLSSAPVLQEPRAVYASVNAQTTELRRLSPPARKTRRSSFVRWDETFHGTFHPITAPEASMDSDTDSVAAMPLLLRHLSSFSVDGYSNKDGDKEMPSIANVFGKQEDTDTDVPAVDSHLANTAPHDVAITTEDFAAHESASNKTPEVMQARPFELDFPADSRLDYSTSRGETPPKRVLQGYMEEQPRNFHPLTLNREIASQSYQGYRGMGSDMTAYTCPTENQVVVHTPHGPALLLGSPTVTTPSRVRQPTVLTSPSSQRKFQRWSEEEDAVLRHAIEAEGSPPYNWKRISRTYFANSRSGLQCKSRWTKSLQPGLVVGGWQPEEDELIRTLRSNGFKWSEIAEQLPGRIGEHVRDRYVNFLDPELKRTPWSKEEDEILFEQQRLLGNKWTSIARMLPGRSENSVKNRWHNAKMTQRRKIRKHANEKSLRERGARARQHLNLVLGNESLETSPFDGAKAEV